MSPQVDNFVHSLVEMAKAQETLPQVQQELEQTKVERQSLLDRIDRINADLEQSRNYAASLEQRNHDLEVARDDAEMRFLELDEKTSGAVHQAMDLRSLAESLIARLDPPKPQHEPEAHLPHPDPQTFTGFEPKTADVGPGPSEVPPTSPSTSMELPVEASGGELDWKQDQAETSTLPPSPTNQGQGEVNPTANTVSGQSLVVDQASVSSNPNVEPKSSGPYANKRYYDHPTYVPLWDWIDGGGTEESYAWAPDMTRDPLLF